MAARRTRPAGWTGLEQAVALMVQFDVARSRRCLMHSLLVCCCLACAPAWADSPARIAIIIDDLGFQREPDLAVLELSTDIAVAIIPNAPLAREMSRRARAQGREVLIHLPLADPEQQDCDAPICPRREWSAERMRRHLAWSLEQVEGAVGINNHRGSQFTSDPAATRRLIEGLILLNQDLPQPLFVIDSRTSALSVLADLATEAGLRTAQRRVFLDHERTPEAMQVAWQQLLARARSEGMAIAIGHPYPETLRLLATHLPQLAEYGVELVPVSTLLSAPESLQARPGQRAAAAAYGSPTAPARP